MRQFLTVVVVFFTALMSFAQRTFYGAIDLGPKGAKGVLYSFATEAEGPVPDIIFARTINTRLVSSMREGNFTADGINDAIGALKQLLDSMKAEAAKRSVSVDFYYVLANGDVARGANKEELATAIRETTGINIDFVDAEREGYYNLVSAVPRDWRPTAVYIDIGSGNTKLGCLTTDGAGQVSFKSALIPFGSTTGRNEALKRSPQDMIAGMDSVRGEVSESYQKASLAVPCLRDRKRVYWTGGASWATATFTHPEKELNNWVTITKQDLDSFLASLENGTWNEKRLAFSFPSDVPLETQNLIRTHALKEWMDVQDIFTRDDLLSGASIMETALSSYSSAVVIQFCRSCNFIYGYALDKFGANADRNTKAAATHLPLTPRTAEPPIFEGAGIRAPLNSAQIQTLITEGMRLRNRSTKLQARVASIGATDSMKLRSAIKKALVESIEDLNTTERDLKSQYALNTLSGGGADTARKEFFEDLRLNYVDVLRTLEDRQSASTDGSVSFLRTSGMASASVTSPSEAGTPLVAETLNAIEENRLAYATASETSDLKFDLTIYSVPQGAIIEYKRRGDQFEKNRENTNSTISALTLARWTFRISIEGYEDQQFDYDPFREHERRIDVNLKPRKKH